MKEYKFESLQGKVLTEVVVNDDKTEVLFHTSGGEVYKLYHEQDCCESVWLEDVCGDLGDLIGPPLAVANECHSESIEDTAPYGDSQTWTFYNMATTKGSVTLRWFGTSNGYYSESVDFEKVC